MAILVARSSTSARTGKRTEERSVTPETGTAATARAESEVLYYYMDSDAEYPVDAEIPLATVRQAAHEYLTTGGQRPTRVTWQVRESPGTW